ncbi:lytic murein transglycosylase [Legionella quinlivanii]|uniref:Lytic murein transglycosylase n=1 Tax=Legionella quinlivanii TaxID=45073 RepID=A0A0W0Y628_9GAMM|nr:lytic murein transglycosylase [Legionella quinlivanii]KTD52030.1 lytic murein transglycosylase [Legionella quinlivanii]MCW8452294.1 lytic murein transglycosylase [Legionella quinlivanii]SEF88102.1 membrane-bound lytic murein transglycosylase B [Legionella quinlivanii DSM 21216]STY12474.1 lytic murein transglycosylase [Legionella quinlivanii]
MKKVGLKALACLLGAMTSMSYANQQSWNSWVAGVRQEALSQGIPASLFDQAFADIHEPSRQVKSLARSQPEHRLTFTKYLNTRADAYRIAMGKKNYQRNKELLDQVGQSFGVDPCFIVSFWGMETSYGTYMGDFPVIKSLATLAYDSNRQDFFRKQLMLALHIVNDGHVSLKDFKGEWAGASGQPQFLPSSWVEYAVDYDGDGRKDIWKAKADVFASIANYMKKNGWQTGEPWAIHVRLPANFDKSLEGKTTVKPVSEWNAMGVRTTDGKPLPYQNLEASIVQPNGGPVFLAFPNYKMILRYNNSIYYAGAIGYMADKICGRVK